MSGEDLQRQTSINIQEKANLIWAIADKLVGLYKPHEYGKVILPMCVIKRFEDTLAPTKNAVIKMNEELEAKGIAVKKSFLEAAAKQKFYNTSKFTFDILLADADNIKDNFESYLNHFSENVIDIINRMDFYNGRQQPSIPRYKGVLLCQGLSWCGCCFGRRYGLYL